MGRHEHGASNHAFRVGEASGHPEVDDLCLLFSFQVNDILQFEIAMVDTHGVKGLYASEQVEPNLFGVFFAELFFLFEHVVIEIQTTRKVLGDNIVVGL